MKYQQFLEMVASIDWHQGEEKIFSNDERLWEIIEQIDSQENKCWLKLLSFATEFLEEGEIYCQVGCGCGVSLAAALYNYPRIFALAIDELPLEAEDILITNVAKFGISEQIFFYNAKFINFFYELRQIGLEESIGLYVYNATSEYRSQLLGLLLVRPFLAERATILVRSQLESTEQSIYDFLAIERRAQIATLCSHSFDNFSPLDRFYILTWDVACQNYYDIGHYDRNFLQKLADSEVQKVKEQWSTAYQKAIGLQEKGVFSTAQQIYQQLLKWEPNNFSALFNLAMVYYSMGQDWLAYQTSLKATSIEPDNAVGHYGLGLACQKLDRDIEASTAYQNAIALDEDRVDAYNNLGNIFYSQGEFEKAESVYRKAADRNLKHAGSYLNLGNALIVQSRFEDAIVCYKLALQNQPDCQEIHKALAVAERGKSNPQEIYLDWAYQLYRSKHFAAASCLYEKARKIGGLNLHAYLAYYFCLSRLKQNEAAISLLKDAIQANPDRVSLYEKSILSLKRQGAIQKAMEVASESVRLFPEEPSVRLLSAQIVPYLYESDSEIIEYREKLNKDFDRFIYDFFPKMKDLKKKLFQSLELFNSFYMLYQGKNDRELQKKHAFFIYEVMRLHFSTQTYALRMPFLANGKIRVGYLSQHMEKNRLGQFFIGWLRHCNRQKFDIHCYYLGENFDELTAEFQKLSDRFYQNKQCDDIETIYQHVLQDDLHILVIPEIGLSPCITKLAALRLAPVQCTTWAHPVTSGSPTIDYYLSSTLMELEDGQEYYSEKLVELPKIGFCYRKPRLATTHRKRAHFQLREDEVIYLSCQNLLKYLPGYDWIYAEIIQRVSNARIVFIAHPIERITQIFQERLGNTFNQCNLNFEECCTIIPRLNEEDYIDLNLVSDIFLDSLDWSGGLTTLKAVACDLPIVTRPGKLMRGKHSTAILETLGITRTSVSTEKEYVETAVRLGQDPQWRLNIVRQMKENQENLYEDITCVQTLEAFYQRVVEQALQLQLLVRPTAKL